MGKLRVTCLPAIVPKQIKSKMQDEILDMLYILRTF